MGIGCSSEGALVRPDLDWRWNSPSSMSFRIGDKVGDYRIVGAVGSGGAGQVFRVEHNLTGRLDAM